MNENLIENNGKSSKIPSHTIQCQQRHQHHVQNTKHVMIMCVQNNPYIFVKYILL